MSYGCLYSGSLFETRCIFFCEVCRQSKAGREYIGHLNTTVTGIQCQKWTSNTPHEPMLRFSDTTFPDGSRAAAENYCRNPDASWFNGVWCYTMDPDVRWDVCDVPECGKSFSTVYTFSFVFIVCVVAAESHPTQSGPTMPNSP